MQTYLALVIAGTVLMVLEIFIPGGIAGLAGGLLFLLAAWHAFVAFDGWTGMGLAIAAIVAACAFVTLVVTLFPRTRVGKKLALPTPKASPTPRCDPPDSPRWAGAAWTSCRAATKSPPGPPCGSWRSKATASSSPGGSAVLTDPTDRYRVQRELAPDETLVWAGRPVPRFFGEPDVAVRLVFGLVWSAFVAYFAWSVVVPLWTGAGGDTVFEGQTMHEWVRKPVGERLVPTLYLLPFAAAGVFLVGAPVWNRIRTAGLLYAVTDRRALAIGRARTAEWTPDRMQAVSRSDRRNGLSHLFFATLSVRRGKHGGTRTVPVGFRSLPHREADEAALALRALLAAPGAAGR